MACPFCEPGRFQKDVIETYDLFHRRGVHLTRQENLAMTALLARNGVVTMDNMIAAMWGERDEPGDVTQVVRVQVTKCRKKIEAAGLPWKIHSAFGVGYALDKNEGKRIRGMAVSLVLTICGTLSLSNFF